MWQATSTQSDAIYHFGIRTHGSKVTTACGHEIHLLKSKQIGNYCDIVLRGDICRACRCIYGIVYTSVDEARHSVSTETDMVVLEGALQLTPKSSLQKMLLARMRRIEKDSAARIAHSENRGAA